MATPGFDWSRYLTLATQLSANADEASQRSSMSRAYYCVYHKALERAVANGYVDQRKHFELWELYNRNSPDRDCRKLYGMGTRMKKERVDADLQTEWPSNSVGRIAFCPDSRLCPLDFPNLRNSNVLYKNGRTRMKARMGYQVIEKTDFMPLSQSRIG